MQGADLSLSPADKHPYLCMRASGGALYMIYISHAVHTSSHKMCNATLCGATGLCTPAQSALTYQNHFSLSQESCLSICNQELQYKRDSGSLLVAQLGSNFIAVTCCYFRMASCYAGISCLRGRCVTLTWPGFSFKETAKDQHWTT